MATRGIGMGTAWNSKRGAAAVAAGVLLVASCALAGPVPDYGYDWAVIGDVGNAPIPAAIGGPKHTGRGGVDYAYRMAKTEITTSQWVEFINAASPNFPEMTIGHWNPPFWGGLEDFSYDGPGFQWELQPFIPQAAQLPVGGIRWRTAAMMANWMHNGKVNERWAFEDGAYDISTFGGNNIDGFTDQQAHHPGARFWIPTLDEWLKATHYDPNRYGDGDGGWWLYPYMSDEPPVQGLPGEPGAQTNSGLDLNNNAEWDIPIGSYPDAVTAYGLLDASGQAMEFTEEVAYDLTLGVPEWRVMYGASAGHPDLESAEYFDLISYGGWGVQMDSGFPFAGIRFASAVPSASPLALFVIGMSGVVRRHRRA